MLGGEIWEQLWVQIWGELDQQLAICASFTALSGHHNHCVPHSLWHGTMNTTPSRMTRGHWPLNTIRANTKTTGNTANSSNQLYQDPPLTTLTLAQPQPRPLPSLASPGHFPKITINKSATIYLPPLQSSPATNTLIAVLPSTTIIILPRKPSLWNLPVLQPHHPPPQSTPSRQSRVRPSCK